MRKRLIQKFTKAKEGSLGYTLTELLVVIGIIAVICAIAIPSIIAISRALRFKQRNDYAKSVFMAAQQNLTELRSDGSLILLRNANGAAEIPEKTVAVPEGDGFPDEFRNEYVYTYTGTDAFNLILPAGSIDSHVRAQNIIIEYNPITGNVYSVFYSEEPEGILGDYTAADKYLPREDKAARKKMMLGYYEGSGLNSTQIEMEQTQAEVRFVNGEEGVIQVLIPMPDSFFGAHDEFMTSLGISLTISGEQTMAQTTSNAVNGSTDATQPTTPGGENTTTTGSKGITLPIKTVGTYDTSTCYLSVDGKTVVVEYVIDSLKDKLSFANFASGTQLGAKVGNTSAEKSLTQLMSEEEFKIIPGENITIRADVTYEGDVEIDPGILSGINPMFEYLQSTGKAENGKPTYILAVSNGRNLQNLNALAPSIAEQVESVVFTSDIYWNDTVTYYNNKYDAVTAAAGYANTAIEAPARALPYFVPIHNEGLFGTAKFIFPGEESGGLSDIIGDLLDSLLGSNHFGGFKESAVPTLTDELDAALAISHATIQGNGYRVLNLNIDSTKYAVPNVGLGGTIKNPETNKTETVDLTGKFYATGEYQVVDYAFSGLFGYVNTPINGLHVVNPIVKGHEFTQEETVVPRYITIFGRPVQVGTQRIKLYNNPATGALVGAGGYNTLITNCSTYIDKDARGYQEGRLTQEDYAQDAVQNWYGVSGEGAVGGLVGYAKSHRTTTAELEDDHAVLAFSKCFAAVPVSGNMRNNKDKNFGYSNGVGAFIGNSQLTNFYNCYASGNVKATGCRVSETLTGELANWIGDLFGFKLNLPYNGRFSMGAGGFVGTSHGTRYTNCFATGNVTASATTANRGAGGFVGFMSIDETKAYGNDAEIAQHTVFTDCYSVGKAITNSSTYENFSGGNGRVVLSLNTFQSYFVNDYYRLYAPHYVNVVDENGKHQEPGFEDYYLFKHSYYLSNYHIKSEDDQANSVDCAEAEAYSLFTNLPGNHNIQYDANDPQKWESSWMKSQIDAIRNIVLDSHTESRYNRDTHDWEKVTIIDATYQTEYFNECPELYTPNPNPEVVSDYKPSDYIYPKLYDKGFSAFDWLPAQASTTHSYNMGTTGAVYPFSKLVGLDYYGDWPSKPSDVGMAYFETYSDTNETHFLFDKVHEDKNTEGVATLSLRNGTTFTVVKDGYAIFSANEADLTVTLETESGELAGIIKDSGEEHTISTKTYHVFYLNDAKDSSGNPVDLMSVLPKDGEFYVKLTAQHGSGDEYTMYFNPNAALSHVNPAEGKKTAVKPDTTPTTIYVRSARQFKGIAALDDFWGKGMQYIQQLNIDGSDYQWTEADRQVASIGNAGKKFNGSYSAGYAITDAAGSTTYMQYELSGLTPVEAGFFGAIGQDGSVTDVIVECAAVAPLENVAAPEYNAVLAGSNEGTITNVDLTISGTVTLNAEKGAGILAGFHSGTIADCEVAVPNTVSMSAISAGGLVGVAEGTENAKAAVTNCTLNAGQTAAYNVATYAGGAFGAAKHLTAEELTVTLPGMTVTASNQRTAAAAGLAGHAESSGFGACEITMNGDSSIAAGETTGTMAGALGAARDVTLDGVDVTVNNLTGSVAAGFLGSGTNVDATNCNVVLGRFVTTNNSDGTTSKVLYAGSVTGTTVAAGVAGTIGVQSVFTQVPVTLTGATIEATAGSAAGYAVEVQGEATVQNGTVTLGKLSQNNPTHIRSTNGAAGFACTVAGNVDTGSVIGCGDITGNRASGFALDVAGEIAASHVSPAHSASEYLGNANTNLIVSGAESAAGFALTTGKKAVLSNCYTLCRIDAPMPIDEDDGVDTIPGNAYGFAGENKGEITRCYANVDIGGGYAFVGENSGDVKRCYGWYGDHNDRATLTIATIDGGTVESAYFVDLMPADTNESSCVTLYDANGAVSTMSPTELQGSVEALGGGKYTWYSHAKRNSKDEYESGYRSYPYNDKSNSTMPDYGYPMLRAHYGDWLTPPQYAYGVAYYETYAKGIKVHLMDLSNPSVTREGDNISTYLDIDGAEKGETTVFDNTGDILETGYAIFCKTGYNNLKSITSETAIQNVTVGGREYTLYEFKEDALKGGIISIAATTDGSSAATVDTRFADAINETGAYEVRTAAQFANVGQMENASFEQTHDLEVGKEAISPATIVSGKTYTAKTYDNGAVTLTFGEPLNGSVFAAVEGSVTLGNVTFKQGIGENGALAAAVSGTFNTGAIETGEVNGKLFGDVTNVETGAISTGAVTGQVFGTVNGTVQTEAITVNGEAKQVFGNVESGSVTVNGTINVDTVNGTSETDKAMVFGDVTNSAKVTVSGDITTGEVGQYSQLFGTISSTAADYAVDVPTISTKGNNVDGQIFGDVTNVKTGAISTGAVTGQVFGRVNGTVQTEAITVNGEAKQVFGNVAGTGSVTVDGDISTKSVTGQVFGKLESGSDKKVKVNAITTNGNSVTGQIFGDVTNVETGAITTGVVSGQVFGTVNGTVETDAITINGDAAQVFGAVNSDNVTTGLITVNGNATNVFQTVSGQTTTVGITVTGNADVIFGEVKAALDSGDISVGGILSGSVIEQVASGAKATIGAVDLGSIAESGMVLGSATGGEVKFGDINLAAAVSGVAETEPVEEPSEDAGETTERVEDPTETTGETIETVQEEPAALFSGFASTKAKAANGMIANTLFGGISGGAKVSGQTILPELTLENYLFESVTGDATVSGFQVTADSMTKSLVGGSLEGTLSGIGLTADSATDVSGILVEEVASGSITGCTVDVDAVTTGAEVFGGLTGVNHDTLSNNTVKIPSLATADSQVVGGLVGENHGAVTMDTTATVDVAITYSNANAGTSFIGGLAGANSGSITGTTGVTVKASIDYKPVSGSTTSIGGLVGDMGTEDDCTLNTIGVSGQITLDGESSDKYYVGGAVGNFTDGTATNVTANVVVDTDWAKANTASDTFGDGIISQGPVGMFVGYADAVTLTNCSSTETGNATYQFLGEALIGSAEDKENAYWTAEGGYDKLNSYSDSYDEKNKTYTTYDDPDDQNDAADVIVSKAPDTRTQVKTKLANCTFYFRDERTVRAQILGNDVIYYDMGKPIEHSKYKLADPLHVSFTSVGTKTFRSDSSDNGAGLYYNIPGSENYALVKDISNSRTTFTLTYYLGDNTTSTETFTGEWSISWSGIYYKVDIDNLYELDSSASNFTSDKYLVVSGTTAVYETSSTDLPTGDPKEFLQRDDLYDFIYTYKDSKLGEHAVNPINAAANFYTSDTPVMEYTVGNLKLMEGENKITNFQLIPLEETPNHYQQLTFTRNETAYQDAYVTFSPMIENLSLIDIEEETKPVETTDVTEETVTGETEPVNEEKETVPVEKAPESTEPVDQLEITFDDTLPTEPETQPEETTAPTEPVMETTQATEPVPQETEASAEVPAEPETQPATEATEATQPEIVAYEDTIPAETEETEPTNPADETVGGETPENAE